MDLIGLFEKLGYPVAMSVYLLYLLNSNLKFLGKKIDEIKNIMIDTATQMSYLVSANMNYRSGNIDNGDALSGQVVYMGDKIKVEQANQDKKKEGGDA